jgi:ribosomal protein S18 acetylase RimI-like enzyme
MFAENKAQEFAPLGLGEMQLKPLLDMQYRARGMGYAASFPNAEQQVVLNGYGEVVGQVLVNEDARELRIVDIAILSEQRGKGFGTVVMEQMQHRASSSGKTLRLHVANGSPAARLYSRLGFITVSSSMIDTEMEWVCESAVEEIA